MAPQKTSANGSSPVRGERLMRDSTGVMGHGQTDLMLLK